MTIALTGKMSGTADKHTADSLKASFENAWFAAARGAFEGKLSDAPENLPAAPILLFAHGSSGIGAPLKAPLPASSRASAGPSSHPIPSCFPTALPIRLPSRAKTTSASMRCALRNSTMPPGTLMKRPASRAAMPWRVRAKGALPPRASRLPKAAGNPAAFSFPGPRKTTTTSSPTRRISPTMFRC